MSLSPISSANIETIDLLSLLPDDASLQKIIENSSYSVNKPFPHIQLDNFLPIEGIEAALNSFPSPSDTFWQKFKNLNEVKLANSVEKFIPPSIRNILYALNSQTFLIFLERITGIKGLIPDPYFTGGGLHQIQRGGKLGIHIDFNRDARLNLDRRLNLLIYLNKNWKEEYGGHLELWSTDGKKCIESILPVFNRCVIFSTTENSYHGHPHPLQCPEGFTRKSLALYYYSNGRSASEKVAGHSTIFIPHNKFSNAKSLVHRVLGQITPPIISRLFK